MRVKIGSDGLPAKMCTGFLNHKIDFGLMIDILTMEFICLSVLILVLALPLVE